VSTPILNRGECCPIAQFKSVPRLLEIRSGDFVQLQRITGGENQMVETSQLLKERPDTLLVCEVDRVPLCLPSQLCDGLLDPLRVT
jgi:hypothetical protein